jgi:AcrR family transcriptional regulator
VGNGREKKSALREDVAGESPRLPIVGQAMRPVERADAARNRAAILDAARKLLKKRPIGEICMDELAEAAGVGKGTLYRRFADRSSLCRALLDEEAAKLQHRVLTGFDLPLRARFVDRLDHLLDALFEFVADNAALLSEAAAFERGQPTRFDHPAHTWMRDTIALYLTKAAEKGEMEEVPAETTADFILTSLDPDLLRWHMERGRSRETLRRDFRRFWREGVNL